MTYPILDGKAAIVTGAARGMGEATAKLFAEAKAKVIVVDVNEEKGNKVVSDIKKNGGHAYFVKTDISNSEQVQQQKNQVIKRSSGSFNNMVAYFNQFHQPQ